MSNPIDVGSVLGGRYKVTATVLASHDRDLVLDGVDQVLNRPVSILVAGPGNTEQVAQSAREVATGERPGTVQVLDLGVTEAATYLITNHTSPADLLDLLVAPNPPYVEPFFTDTLGSEIFGQPRSKEPEPYDDEEDVPAGYIHYPDAHSGRAGSYPVAPGAHPEPPTRPAPAPAAGTQSPASSRGVADASAGAAAGRASGTDSPDGRAVHPAGDTTTAAFAPGSGTPEPDSGKPKVSLWSQDDYASVGNQPAEVEPAAEPRPSPSRQKSPSSPRQSSPAVVPAGSYEQEYDGPAAATREPRSKRWLVGGLLAVVLVVGLIFAVTNLGNLFSSQPQANSPASDATSAAPGGSSSPSPAPTSAPPAVPPAIGTVSRLGAFDFAATFDRDLVKSFDGNAASYWSDMEFATENWGGLAEGVPLLVELEGPATISSITLTQLGGSGGDITVYTNDEPTLEGATAVGTNSFTSTDLNIPLAEPVEAQYVIVSIDTLPKLAAPKTRFGYGIRLAEIEIR